MREPVRIAGFVAGLVIVVVTATSVFTTLVIPRATSSRLLRSVSRFLAKAIAPLLRRLETYEAKDRVVSLVGPGGMLVLFGAWLGLLMLGFALMIWWVGGETLTGSLGVSGSSIFTLGILSGNKGANRALEIVEAGAGFLVIALEIAYLPTLYAAFSARETEVTLLAARGGVPAWGPEILSRHARFHNLDELPELYANWERWAAAVSESHTGYPSLMWFRSPEPTRSWLLALVAVLDAAAMHLALAPSDAPRQARLCLRMGTNCLRSLAEALRIPYNADPLPTDPVRLTKAEFDEGFDLLESVHFPIESTREEAWDHFKGWRVNYEPMADELTHLVLPPPAPWLLPRPQLGSASFPRIVNRTPDHPEGAEARPFKQP
ncbi:MAG: hypothetical protein ACRDV6_00020 [Acidimicrobiales bacterium]